MARTARGLAALLQVGVLVLGFGTTSGDAEKLRAFDDAVARWQHDPDFRPVQTQYVELGSQAVRTRVAGIRTGEAILMLRSLPGLPEYLRVNSTSQAHYQSFSDGPLSAYLHLAAEQGLPSAAGLLQDLGRRGFLSDQEIVSFLGNFKLHDAVIADAGAVRSVRSLIGDVDPARGFPMTTGVVEKIQDRASKLAAEMGYPADLAKMSPAQQQAVWNRLDASIKHYDPELWRSKQVNDWLSGIWAQGYGPMYSSVIGPTLKARRICRVGGPLVLLGWIGLALRRRRRAAIGGATAGAAIAALAMLFSLMPSSSAGTAPATAPATGPATRSAADPTKYLADVCALLKQQWPHNRAVHVVCHGHSVPAGYFKTPAVQAFDAYPRLLHKSLCDAFPTAVINVTVTAVGGEAAEAGAARFDRDVLSLHPDVVTIDYALNDRFIGLPRARKAWVTMIDKAQAANAKVILLTPTADTRAHLDDPNDPINQHAQQIRELAAEYHVGLVDSLALFQRYVKDGGKLEDVMAQINHPNRKGHDWVAAELMRWFPG